MTTVAADEMGNVGNPTRELAISSGGWVSALAIGLSACLLFTLELMVGQLLLPLLGGAPSVWATTLGFFQLCLLLGYLYAHVSVTRLGRLGPVLHLALVAAAVVALVAGPRVSDLHFDNLSPVLQVLTTLTVAVGLPAFALCATTPLLSAWLDDSLRAHRQPADGPGRDPYRLYVVSNAGSLLALLAYPFLVQPFLGLSAQRVVWSIGFVALFGLLVAARVARAAGASAGEPGTAIPAQRDRSSSHERIGARRIATWIALAAIPCGMLSATTNFIAADLISAPLLWVGPLAVYLATFIAAFSVRGLRWVRIATLAAPAMAMMLWMPIASTSLWPALPLLLLEYLGFGVVALALHGRLAADRPSAQQLTFFYLMVSTGGVIGGAFVGFLAPVVFPGIWEYPILLVAALLALPSVGLPSAAAVASGGGETPRHKARGLNLRPLAAGARTRLKPYAVIAGVSIAAAGIAQPIAAPVVFAFVLLGAALLTIGARPRLFAGATAILLVAVMAVQPLSSIYTERSFFGVVTVRQSATDRMMVHGTTNHGSQALDPARSRDPRTYYDRRGPLGDAMALAQARGGQNIGVVGLGSGSIAAYERPNDHMTFIEIDPAVIRIAEDPRFFTYLSEAPNKPDVILGDGRLELQKIPDATYDLLILDAFSGDAIPTHLLTVEALRDDTRVLRPGGMIIVHMSNRFYDLTTAVAAGGRQIGLSTALKKWVPTGQEQADGATGSWWVMLSKDPTNLAPLLPKGWSMLDSGATPITDDFPDVLRFARFDAWLTGH